MEMLKTINLAIRFLLELCALAALAYGGFHTGQRGLLQWLLGLGAPLLAAAVWGLFVAPKAAIAVPAPVRLAFELAVFAAAAAGLALARQPALAWALGLAYLANKILLFLSG
jgi:hypothetical protein